MNKNSHVSCLPIWVSKTIEADASDVSLEQQTQSQKKHANIALMTHVLETFDPFSYSNAQR
jgi:hypothetical protein